MAGDQTLENAANEQRPEQQDVTPLAQNILETAAQRIDQFIEDNIQNKLDDAEATLAKTALDFKITQDIQIERNVENSETGSTSERILNAENSSILDFIRNQHARSGADGSIATAHNVNNNNDEENPRGRRRGQNTLDTASLLQLSVFTPQNAMTFLGQWEEETRAAMKSVLDAKTPEEQYKLLQDARQNAYDRLEAQYPDADVNELKKAADDYIEKKLEQEIIAELKAANPNISDADLKAQTQTQLKTILQNEVEMSRHYAELANSEELPPELITLLNDINAIDEQINEVDILHKNALEKEKIETTYGPLASKFFETQKEQLVEQRAQKMEDIKALGVSKQQLEELIEQGKLDPYMDQNKLKQFESDLKIKDAEISKAEQELKALENELTNIEQDMRASMDIPEEHKDLTMEEARFQMEGNGCGFVNVDGTGDWRSKANSDATTAAGRLAISDNSEKWKDNNERLKELKTEDNAEPNNKLSNTFNNAASENDNTAEVTQTANADAETADNLTLDAPHPAEMEHRAQMVNKIENYAAQIKTSGVNVATLEDLHTVLELEGSEALKHNSLIEKTLADAGIEVKDAFDPNPQTLELTDKELAMNTPQPTELTLQNNNTMSMGMG